MTDYIDLFSHLFHTRFSGDLGLPSLCPQLRSWVPLPGTSVDTFITGLAAFNQLLPSPILPLPHSRVVGLKHLIPPFFSFKIFCCFSLPKLWGSQAFKDLANLTPNSSSVFLHHFGPTAHHPFRIPQWDHKIALFHFSSWGFLLLRT